MINVIPMRPADLIRVAVPRLNKCDHIEEYLKQIDSRHYDLEWARVTETRTLTVAEWNDLMHGLLTDREWLNGKGGSNTWAFDNDPREWFQLSEDEQELARKTSYLLVVAVQCAGAVLYIDPQGYSYARYMAFPADGMPDGKSREEIRKEEAQAAATARAEALRNMLENPPAVPANHGLRFFWNGIKSASGKLEKCQYSRGALVNYNNADVISIYCRDWRFSDEVRAVFTVTNDSDPYSDYHADDTIRLLPVHPLYQDVLKAFEAQESHYAQVAEKRNAKYAKQAV